MSRVLEELKSLGLTEKVLVGKQESDGKKGPPEKIDQSRDQNLKTSDNNADGGAGEGGDPDEKDLMKHDDSEEDGGEEKPGTPDKSQMVKSLSDALSVAEGIGNHIMEMWKDDSDEDMDKVTKVVEHLAAIKGILSGKEKDEPKDDEANKDTADKPPVSNQTPQGPAAEPAKPEPQQKGNE